jgi:putative endonuclease
MISGRGAYLSGLAAEEIAARLYRDEGGRVLATRWRCPEGEIDLVLALPGQLVFVEVKARRSRDGAAGALSAAQRRRLAATASRYLAEVAGEETACRFDLVLLDRSGAAERIENALSFDEW